MIDAGKRQAVETADDYPALGTGLKAGVNEALSGSYRPRPRFLTIFLEDEDDDRTRTTYLRSRLDVHEHICNTRVALLDCCLDSMRDLVAFVHGNVPVDADM